MANSCDVMTIIRVDWKPSRCLRKDYKCILIGNSKSNCRSEITFKLANIQFFSIQLRSLIFFQGNICKKNEWIPTKHCSLHWKRQSIAVYTLDNLFDAIRENALNIVNKERRGYAVFNIATLEKTTRFLGYYWCQIENEKGNWSKNP